MTQLPSQARVPAHLSRSLFLLLWLVLLAVLFGPLFFVQLEGHGDVNWAVRLVSPYRIVAEILFAAGLITLLANGPAWSRTLAYLVFALLIFTLVAQYTSIRLTGAYLTPTALENTRHLGLILNTTRAVAILAVVLLTALLILKTEIRFEKARNSRAMALAIACFLLAGAFEFDRLWLSEDVQARRFKLFHFANNYMADSAPVRALAESISSPWQAGQEPVKLSADELRTARSMGIEVDE